LARNLEEAIVALDSLTSPFRDFPGRSNVMRGADMSKKKGI